MKSTYRYVLFESEFANSFQYPAKEEAFEIDICDANFIQKPFQKNLIASVHEGKKPFKCDI